MHPNLNSMCIKYTVYKLNNNRCPEKTVTVEESMNRYLRFYLGLKEGGLLNFKEKT
jgi:hypothetical protein